jgi:Spy/CpxP family protein refolding chaperone
MRNLCKLTLTLALVALMASPALAQRPRQRPGGGGPGGFRLTADALLTNKSVQEELKLSKDQQEKLTAISKKRNDLFRNRDLSREDRQKAMKEIGDETKKVAEGLTSTQKKRLDQIVVQAQGVRAFSDKKVQEALKLTDEQKTAIKDITEGIQKKVQEETKDLEGRERFTKGREIRQKLTKEAMGKIASKLSSDQKKTWKELVGAPFEIKFEGFGRPGGGRRPGGTPRRDI